MAWYDRILGRTPEVEEKLNPAQQYYDHTTTPSREFTFCLLYTSDAADE